MASSISASIALVALNTLRDSIARDLQEEPKINARELNSILKSIDASTAKLTATNALAPQAAVVKRGRKTKGAG